MMRDCRFIMNWSHNFKVLILVNHGRQVSIVVCNLMYHRRFVFKTVVMRERFKVENTVLVFRSMIEPSIVVNCWMMLRLFVHLMIFYMVILWAMVRFSDRLVMRCLMHCPAIHRWTFFLLCMEYLLLVVLWYFLMEDLLLVMHW